jgi:di/tricarboxylate transporter
MLPYRELKLPVAGSPLPRFVQVAPAVSGWTDPGALDPSGWRGLEHFEPRCAAITGWFVEAVNVRAEAVLIALVCCLTSVAQRRLSTPARELRRQTISLTGRQTLRDGQVLELDSERVLAPLEGALSALWMAMVILAIALVVRRL